MNRTGIQYLDYSWNPVTGCTPIGTGCKNCWAQAMAKRLAGMGIAGYDKQNPFKVTLHPDRLDEPLSVKKPARIGVAFMGDLFHDNMPVDMIYAVLSVIESSPQHTYLMLTKRSYNAAKVITLQTYAGPVRKAGYDILGPQKYVPYNTGFPFRNLWLGTSISCQEDADKNIPHLLQVPAAVRYLSIEPMVGPVILEDYDKLLGKPHLGRRYLRKTIIPPTRDTRTGERFPMKVVEERIDWVICGCESGPKRRPCNIAWIRDVVSQCKNAGVKVFVKQLDIGNKVIEDINEFPEDLRIREYPEVNK